MASKVQIANMALGRIGVSQRIANVDTEDSIEARQCRTFYDQDVEFVLRSFEWPFATGYRQLALVTEEPSDDWAYAYRVPVDSLKVRRIVTALGRDDPNPPPFVLGQDSQGPLLYTSEEDPTIEYTVNITDPGRFDPIFVEALSWKLASDIAPALSRIKGAAEAAFKMFIGIVGLGEVVVANEQQKGVAPDSEFVRARE